MGLPERLERSDIYFRIEAESTLRSGDLGLDRAKWPIRALTDWTRATAETTGSVAFGRLSSNDVPLNCCLIRYFLLSMRDLGFRQRAKGP